MVHSGYPLTYVQLPHIWEIWGIFMQHKRLLWRTCSSLLHTHTHTQTYIWRKPMGLYTICPRHLSVAQLPGEYMMNSFLVLSHAAEEQSHSSVIPGVICWHNVNVNKKSSYFLTAQSGKPQNLAVELTTVATNFSSDCSLSLLSHPVSLVLCRKKWNIYQGIMFWMLESYMVMVLAFLIAASVDERNKPFIGIF